MVNSHLRRMNTDEEEKETLQSVLEREEKQKNRCNCPPNMQNHGDPLQKHDDTDVSEQLKLVDQSS